MNETRTPSTVDFAIYVDYERGSEAPERVFVAVTELISAMQYLDEVLMRGLSSQVSPVLLLEDIEAGSLKVWLSTVLKSIDDKALGELDTKKLIGAYLVKAKQRIVDFLDGRTTVATVAEVDELQDGLQLDAESTNLLPLPFYPRPRSIDLLHGVSALSEALSHLKGSDTASLFTADGEFKFNLAFRFSPASIQELLTVNTRENVIQAQLQLRKPDYLGDTRWEFRYNGRMIAAYIDDDVWIRRFRNREYDLRPGDSIVVDMRTVDKFDVDGGHLSTEYTVLNVLEILPGRRFSQEEIGFEE